MLPTYSETHQRAKVFSGMQHPNKDLKGTKIITMDTEMRSAIANYIFEQMETSVRDAYERFLDSKTSNLTLAQIADEFKPVIKGKHGEFVEMVLDNGFGFKFRVDGVLYQASFDPSEGIESYELTRSYIAVSDLPTLEEMKCQ